ncbi:1951_t:CDS:2, partial [Funneliformis caledonium]
MNTADFLEEFGEEPFKNKLDAVMLGLSAENFSLCPKHPRVKEFHSQAEVLRLQQIITKFIYKGSQLNPSILMLLEVLQS